MFDVGHLIIVSVISAAGGFIQRVTGFGFGIFVMLFFPYVMQKYTSAAAVSTLISSVLAIYNSIIYRKNIPYKKIIPLIISALVTIPIAVYFSVLISGDFFKKALGVVLIGLSIYFLFFNNHIKVRATVKNSVIAGGVGGMLSGLFSTGGPPLVLYITNAFTDNTVYFASIQFCFGLTGIYATVVRAFNGIITLEVIFYFVIGCIGSIVGNYVGKKVFNKLNSEKLRLIIYLCMIASGIIMII